MDMKRKIFLLTVIMLIKLELASAYIDPGTGGMIISSSGSIIGLILAMIAAFLGKYFWKPIKKFFLKIIKVFRSKK